METDGGGGGCDNDVTARFWRRKLDGIALDVSNKKCFPIEFKRTQDYRHTYEERARNRASEQYKSLLGGLQATTGVFM